MLFLQYISTVNIQNTKPVQNAQVSYIVHFLRCTSLNDEGARCVCSLYSCP